MYATGKYLSQVQQFLATFGNGRLYNWWAASHALIAPTGCHVATDAEWNVLTDYLGGLIGAAGILKSTRTSISPGWTIPNTGALDSVNFKAFGSGLRLSNGNFSNISNRADIWTATGYNTSNAWRRNLVYNSANVVRDSQIKIQGFAIRCIVDVAYYEGLKITDVDGNVYTTVKIGNQVWLQSNLKVVSFNDGTGIPFQGTNPGYFTNAEWGALTGPGQCTYNNAAIAEYTEPL